MSMTTPAPSSASHASGGRPTGLSRSAGVVLGDVVGPIAVYFVAQAAVASAALALALGGVVCLLEAINAEGGAR